MEDNAFGRSTTLPTRPPNPFPENRLPTTVEAARNSRLNCRRPSGVSGGSGARGGGVSDCGAGFRSLSKIPEPGRREGAELNGRRAWLDSDRVSEDERRRAESGDVG